MADMSLQVDAIAAQDPEYLAFMRGAGYSEAEVMAELARKQGSLQRQLERSAPRFADELRQAETGVQQDFTNRGLYRSGARMVDQVDAGNAVRRNEQEFRFGIRDQQGDLTAGAMRDIADQRRAAMDMALTSRQTAALNAANNMPGNMPTSHNLGPEPGPRSVVAPGGGRVAPGGMPAYKRFRDRTTSGRPGTRGPVAY